MDFVRRVIDADLERAEHERANSRKLYASPSILGRIAAPAVSAEFLADFVSKFDTLEHHRGNRMWHVDLSYDVASGDFHGLGIDFGSRAVTTL